MMRTWPAMQHFDWTGDTSLHRKREGQGWRVGAQEGKRTKRRQQASDQSRGSKSGIGGDVKGRSGATCGSRKGPGMETPAQWSSCVRREDRTDAYPPGASTGVAEVTAASWQSGHGGLRRANGEETWEKGGQETTRRAKRDAALRCRRACETCDRTGANGVLCINVEA
jgi:hypothetical protein